MTTSTIMNCYSLRPL